MASAQAEAEMVVNFLTDLTAAAVVSFGRVAAAAGASTPVALVCLYVRARRIKFISIIDRWRLLSVVVGGGGGGGDRHSWVERARSR